MCAAPTTHDRATGVTEAQAQHWKPLRRKTSRPAAFSAERHLAPSRWQDSTVSWAAGIAALSSFATVLLLAASAGRIVGEEGYTTMSLRMALLSATLSNGCGTKLRTRATSCGAGKSLSGPGDRRRIGRQSSARFLHVAKRRRCGDARHSNGHRHNSHRWRWALARKARAETFSGSAGTGVPASCCLTDRA